MPDLRADLEAALGARYTVERELGGGGMSRVFQVRDTTLERRIVVKVLHPDLAHAVSAERFRREISVAARLQHPQVVPLLDAGEVTGLPWYSMPYIEGESLRAELGRRGELPIAEAVRVLLDIARGLAYAHQQGVVHRDVKPENVLLAGGSASLTDFGVARAVSLSTTAGDVESLTSVGVALGTPQYMAPEQAAADPATDHRADLYALGVVAYELLCGAAPFSGRPPAAMLAAHATEAPEDVLKRRPTLPPALDAVVMKLLAKRPADRYQTASEVVMALEAVPVSGATAVAAPGSPSAASGAPAGGRRARRWAMGVAVMATAVAAALLAFQGREWGARGNADGDGWEVDGIVFFPMRTDTLPIAIAPFADASGGPSLARELSEAHDALQRTLAAQQLRTVPVHNVRADGAGDTARVRVSVEGTAESLWVRVRIGDRVGGRDRWDFVTLRQQRGDARLALEEATERIAGWAHGLQRELWYASSVSLPPRLSALVLFGEGNVEEARRAAPADDRWVVPILMSLGTVPDSIARREAAIITRFGGSTSETLNEYSTRRRLAQAAALGVPGATLELAAASIRLGRPKEALSIVEHDETPAARVIAGNALAMLGRFDEAESVLAAVPAQLRAWEWAMLAAYRGDAAAAVRRIRESAPIPGTAASLLTEVASVLARTAPQVATDSLIRAGVLSLGLDARPSDAVHAFVLLQLHLATGDTVAIDVSLEQARQLTSSADSTMSEFLRALQAIVGVTRGDSSLARALLRPGALSPFGEVAFGPALLANLGEREAALAVLKRYGECCGLLNAPSHYPILRSLNGWPPYEEFLRGQPDDAPARRVPAPRRR